MLKKFSKYVDINKKRAYTTKNVENILTMFFRENKDEAKYKPAVFRMLAKQIKELVTFIRKNKIRDIYDDQLGANKAGKIILLDYGMNQEIWDKYYEHR